MKKTKPKRWAVKYQGEELFIVRGLTYEEAVTTAMDILSIEKIEEAEE